MRAPVLLDTGPLVALLNRRERLHQRVKDVLSLLPSPLLTVEPVLSEAIFLLRSVPKGPHAVMALVRDGLLRVPLAIELPGLPTLITVNAGQTNAGTLLRRREGRYDSAGNLVALISSIDAATSAETR